jgi:hypothetical protein
MYKNLGGRTPNTILSPCARLLLFPSLFSRPLIPLQLRPPYSLSIHFSPSPFHLRPPLHPSAGFLLRPLAFFSIHQPPFSRRLSRSSLISPAVPPALYPLPPALYLSSIPSTLYPLPFVLCPLRSGLYPMLSGLYPMPLPLYTLSSALRPLLSADPQSPTPFHPSSPF